LGERFKKNQRKRTNVETALDKITESSNRDLKHIHTPFATILASLRADTDTTACTNDDIETPDKSIDWENMPACLDMHHGTTPTPSKKKDVFRFEKKKRQCEAFAEVIAALNLPPGATVVDFGCGSCGLTLPLAYTFPHLKFIGIDLKQMAVDLMQQRADEAGLTNVSTVCGDIGAFDEPFDLSVALHACGQASDAAIAQAVARQVPYLNAPCCVGKVKFSLNTAGRNTEYGKKGFAAVEAERSGSTFETLEYPRSNWLRSELCGIVGEGISTNDLYSNIAAAADSSDMMDDEFLSERAIQNKAKTTGSSGTITEYYRRCCSLVCLDRNMFAEEQAGYTSWTCVMKGLENSAKSDLLIGVCNNNVNA
jgi:hypothetical protein